MIKFYSFIALLAFSVFAAQQVISFETSEGYHLGNINGQNGWTVTESSDGPLQNQTVSSEKASVGIYSFKNSHESAYGSQWFPIIGAEKSFSSPLEYKNTVISYDFYATEQLGSDFEFALYSNNDVLDVYDTILAVGFENRGYIYLFTQPNFEGFAYAEQKWEANKWYNLKIRFSENQVTYYLNDEEIYRADNPQLNIDGANFLHNNYGGDAYYDNFKFGADSSLATINEIGNSKIKIYPNPVRDILNFSLPKNEILTAAEVYSVSGNKMMEVGGQSSLDVSKLSTGVYILKIKNQHGTVYSSKFIKK